MKRIHLFEFEDFPWFPEFLRNYMTDFLEFIITRLRFYQPVVPLLKTALEAHNKKEILDLCSGGSGPLFQLHKGLEQQGYSVVVTLSDKYPNLEKFSHTQQKAPDKIKFCAESVDATDIPEHLSGFRTLFTSFHHFRPPDAEKILQDAVTKKAPIGIFEFTERSLILFASLLFVSPLLVFLSAPFIKPFQWRRLVWTYVIPAVPCFVLWDGVASLFRSYSLPELASLTQNIEGSDYKWQMGKLKTPIFGVNVIYLLGSPENEKQELVLKFTWQKSEGQVKYLRT